MNDVTVFQFLVFFLWLKLKSLVVKTLVIEASALINPYGTLNLLR